jgi:hypothetical protein
MSKSKLNKDEKEILKDFEAGEFESVLTSGRKKYIQASAGLRNIVANKASQRAEKTRR